MGYGENMSDSNVIRMRRSYQWHTAIWIKKNFSEGILVELEPYAKRPEGKGWQQRQTDHIFKTWEDENAREGLGCMLGPKLAEGKKNKGSKGPGDIDVDHMPVLPFLEAYLPATACIFGRPGKDKSHWLYNIKGETLAYRKFIDPKTKQGLVEIRGDSSDDAEPLQTRMPGSWHDENTQVVWFDHPDFKNPPDITEVTETQLNEAVCRGVAAYLVAQYVWIANRHEVARSISGFLAHIGWSEADARIFVRLICDQTGDEEPKDRLTMVRDTYKRKLAGKPMSGFTTLKNELGEDAVLDYVRALLAPHGAADILDFNDQFAAVLFDNKSKVAYMDFRPGEDIRFISRADFLGHNSDKRIMGEDGKYKPLAQLWINSPARRTYDHVQFLPGVSDDDLPPKTLNLWTGWRVRPDPEGSCEAFLDFTWSVIAGSDEKLWAWLMNWFAHIFQHPMDKPQTSPVFLSETGAGKTLMMDYLEKILGASFISVNNAEHVHGRFNAHLRRILLLHSEEAIFSKDKGHRSVIKGLVTDKRRMSEQKGVDAMMVPDYTRLALTSNYDDAAPIEDGDRRFTVFDLEDRRASPSLVQAMLDEMKGTGPGALLHYLLDMECDVRLARENIKTKRASQMMAEIADPVISWWWKVLEDGVLLPDAARWCSDHPDDDWPHRVGIQALYRSFQEHCKGTGRRGTISAIAFGMKLGQLVGMTFVKYPVQYHKPDFDADGNYPAWAKELNALQFSIANLPDLDHCRKTFVRKTRSLIDWTNQPKQMGARSTKDTRTDDDPSKKDY